MVFKFFIILLSFTAVLSAESIAEKKASLEMGESDLDRDSQLKLSATNQEIRHLQQKLVECTSRASLMWSQKASDAEYEPLLSEIKEIREQIKKRNTEWLSQVKKSERQEPYSLWHQPETTLGQLIIDYGSSDFVYLLTPELAAKPINISSQLPIPRESWNDLLELILTQQGLSVRNLNTYLREIYMTKSEGLGFTLITDKKRDLELLSPVARVCYIQITDSQDPMKVVQALSRFAPADRIQIQLFGKTIVYMGNAKEVAEIIKVHDFIGSDALNRESKLIVLSKIEGREMELILQAYFQNEVEKIPGSLTPLSAEFKVLSLPTNKQAVFICGTKEQIAQAEKIVAQVEQELQNPQEKQIYWYTCKHTQADELAKILQKIYQLMLTAPNLVSESGVTERKDQTKVAEEISVEGPQMYFGLPPQPPLQVSPPTGNPISKFEKEAMKQSWGNFVVDLNSGSVIMVVEKELLPRLKELIKKIDQPTRMVRIEVLLFEKRYTDKNSFGLNLLRIGSQASNTESKGLAWNWDVQNQKPIRDGILKFLFSHNQHGSVAPFDLAYNFLLTQEDVQINAAPSFISLNQEPARYSIVEELSLNIGAFPVGTDNNNIQNSYSRAQYGITIQVTPTIHLPGEVEEEEDDQTGFVTLDTDITFDTIKPSDHTDRPDVIRRNIRNLVRIPDGQTVILGGLKRKNTHDNEEKIPFLGDIPGIGKLFGNSRLIDQQTEMFIFITPTIIYNGCEQLCRMRYEELRKRPGDIPEFLEAMCQAQESMRHRSLEGGIRMLFGRFGGPCDIN